MQDEDWLVEETGTDSVWGSVVIKRSLNQDLVQRAQDGKLNERDLDIALSLTTFVHDEYQSSGPVAAMCWMTRTSPSLSVLSSRCSHG